MITGYQHILYLDNSSAEIQQFLTGRVCCSVRNDTTYDYDVQYTIGLDIVHADAMPGLKFKDNLVAVAMVTFEKRVFDAEKLWKKLRSKTNNEQDPNW